MNHPRRAPGLWRGRPWHASAGDARVRVRRARRGADGNSAGCSPGAPCPYTIVDGRSCGGSLTQGRQGRLGGLRGLFDRGEVVADVSTRRLKRSTLFDAREYEDAGLDCSGPVRRFAGLVACVADEIERGAGWQGLCRTRPGVSDVVDDVVRDAAHVFVSGGRRQLLTADLGRLGRPGRLGCLGRGRRVGGLPGAWHDSPV